MQAHWNGPSISLPQELLGLIECLEDQQPLPSTAIAAIARWRLACGDARGAALWHRWSLHTPEHERLRLELFQLLLLLEEPDLAQRIGCDQGWEGVLLTLEQEQVEQARKLQGLALKSGIAIKTATALRLAALWQQRGDSQAALELLEPMAAKSTTTGLCNAVAHLHEQAQAPAAAAPWWDRSLQIDLRQPAVLIQRSRNALAMQDPDLAFHLAQTLLELDRHHVVGQELRVEALTLLGARSSQRLALVPLVRQKRDRYRHQAQTLQRWWQPRRRRQQHWRHQQPLLALGPPRPLPQQVLAGCRQVGLLGSRDGLELQDALAAADSPGVLWDIRSREPLCSMRNIKRLLPSCWQLRHWPAWQPEEHGTLDALVIADPKLPIPAGAPLRVLHWQNGWRFVG